jgi:hypothetical protein
MSTLPAKPTKVHDHRRVSSYTFGDYRINVTRCSEGDGVFTRRSNWSSSVITHLSKPGAVYVTGGIKTAVAEIRKGLRQF